MSEGEGAGYTERDQEKLGVQRGRKPEPSRRGHSGCCRGRRGGTSGTGGAAEVVEAVRVGVRVRRRLRV